MDTDTRTRPKTLPEAVAAAYDGRYRAEQEARSSRPVDPSHAADVAAVLLFLVLPLVPLVVILVALLLGAPLGPDLRPYLR